VLVACYQWTGGVNLVPEQNNEKITQGADQRPCPLDGLLIADFSRILAGPYCTMLLPTGRAYEDPTCACSRPLVVSMPRCLAARCRSTALELLPGVALLTCAAGLLGHIAEELRHPIAPDIYAALDRNAVYRPTVSNDITEQH